MMLQTVGEVDHQRRHGRFLSPVDFRLFVPLPLHGTERNLNVASWSRP